MISEHIYIESKIKIKSVEAVYYDGTVKSLREIAKYFKVNVIITNSSVLIDGVSIYSGYYIVRVGKNFHRHFKDDFEKRFIKVT
jgi:hypothetical protein